MKLTHIKATNLLGARNFSTELRAPVLVVASDSNGSGKSSIANAIRLALTGRPARGIEEEGLYIARHPRIEERRGVGVVDVRRRRRHLCDANASRQVTHRRGAGQYAVSRHQP